MRSSSFIARASQVSDSCPPEISSKKDTVVVSLHFALELRNEGLQLIIHEGLEANAFPVAMLLQNCALLASAKISCKDARPVIRQENSSMDAKCHARTRHVQWILQATMSGRDNA